MPPSLVIIPSASATAVVPAEVPPSIKLISAAVAVAVTPSSILISAAVAVIAVPSKLIASTLAVPSINKSLNSREEVPKSISLSVMGTIAPSCILNCCTAEDDTST